MKYPTRLSDAVHIMVYICLNDGEGLSSSDIAFSIKTNPSYVRQLMAKLKAAGLIQSKRGMAKPALTREPAHISLLDVYKAVEGEKPLLHQDTHTNPECGVGVNVQLVLRDCYDQVQQKAEAEMQRITLQDILNRYSAKLTRNDSR